MAKMMDSSLEVSGFDLQSRSFLNWYFWEFINVRILPATGEIVSLLFFSMNDIGIK